MVVGQKIVSNIVTNNYFHWGPLARKTGQGNKEFERQTITSQQDHQSDVESSFATAPHSLISPQSYHIVMHCKNL